MLINNNEYFDILADIKERIKTAQYKAVLSVNREQIILYWNIGKVIIENSQWGSKFIDNLARDIKLEFPNSTGYSTRNLKYMRKFAEIFDDEEIVPTLMAQLTWSHNRLLMDKLKDKTAMIWYADKTVENGAPPRELTKIVKCVKYFSYWEFDNKENYGKAVEWFFAEYLKQIQRLLIAPFDIHCGYSVY